MALQGVQVLQQFFAQFSIDLPCRVKTADETKQVVAPRSIL